MTRVVCCVQSGDDNPGKPSAEVGQYLADVVSAGAKDGEDGITDGAFQGASGEAAVALHVADLSLDGAAAAEVCDQFGRQAAPCAADQDAAPVLAIAAIAAGRRRPYQGVGRSGFPPVPAPSGGYDGRRGCPESCTCRPRTLRPAWLPR